MSVFEQEKHLEYLIAGLLIVALLSAFWGYRSYQQTLASLDRKTAAARTEIKQLHELLQEYRQLAAKLESINPTQNGGKTDNLIATVENAAQQVGGRNQLLYVRPQPDRVSEDIVEEGVEIRLEKLQLQQLVKLLYTFETQSSRVKIKRLRIRTRFDDTRQLDTVITLSRLRERA